MDVFERRRLNLLVILQGMTAAALSEKTGIDPTYISRCKYPRENKAHKKIGEENARKFEKAARHAAGWLDLDHSKKTAPEPHPTTRDLEDLEDARLILLPHQWEDIRARAAHVRATLRPPTLTAVPSSPSPTPGAVHGELDSQAEKPKRRRGSK